ncbi:MAG: hypothetical protein H6625_14000 [Bdellovibrionaceae bacterium]|nr:hypothetical protein [Pseudobdellovibrionaceae bacterium]
MEFSQPDVIVDEIIKRVGKQLVVATPLALGKPPQILNSLYNKAKSDSSIQLTIVTALTLAKPKGNSLLESRFMGPFAERVFGDYPNFLYEVEKNNLPSNIRVVEFYFPAGKYLNVPASQQNYISSNYTHVARDLIGLGVNVVCQLVALSPDSKRLSLSCNPDVANDVMIYLNNHKPYPFVFVGQVNENLPYMYGEADVPKETFHYILKNKEFNFRLFCPPKLSVSIADYWIGLQASTLVKDSGEIQIGIGSLGDSLVHSLILRQNRSEIYLNCLNSLGILDNNKDLIRKVGGVEPLKEGLFAASEMFVDVFMYLIKEGIIKRKVYDHIVLQRLLNKKLITEDVNENTLYLLLKHHAIEPKLTKVDFEFLQKFGIFKSEVKYQDGVLILDNGEKISADLNEDSSHQEIVKKVLGNKLKNGAIVHGGFFLGCNEFYQWLRDLPEELRASIHMKSVLRINQLYGHEELDKLHRKNARFFNTCMMMTLTGAAVSDGLEDGRVVSGVGGQYNFVAMAHELPEGRSVLQMRATRNEKGDVKSNIVFNYGHITIPRHLRDIVITEYGMADLRGKTDHEVIESLIQIADSRFQWGLIEQAKIAKKIPEDFELDPCFQENFPEIIEKKFKKIQEYFPAFPFGTDLTDQEIKIGGGLKKLKKMSSLQLVLTIFKALLKSTDKNNTPYLQRMGLEKTHGLKEKIYAKLLNYVIS